MKSTLTCPKCSGRKLLHVTQIADRVGHGGGRMEHGVDADPDEAQAYPWRIARLRNPGADWLASHVRTAGIMEAVICRACGYTELYAKDPSAIPVDGETVHEIDGSGRGPYR